MSTRPRPTPVHLLVLNLAIGCFGLAQQPANPVPSPTDLLNSPLRVPLDQAAVFSSMGPSWNFSAGYQWRQIGELNFNTGSQAARGTLPWLAGRGPNGSTSSSSTTSSSSSTASGSSSATSSGPTTTTGPTSTTGSNDNTGTAGPLGAYANRTYDNGYVNQDADTAISGDTGFWGYNNASQLTGNTLTQQTTAPGVTSTTTSTTTSGTTTTTNTSSTVTNTSTTATTSTHYSTSYSSWSRLSQDLDWSSDLSGSGWFARVESPAIFRSGPIVLSFELGYSFNSADASRNTPLVFRAHQETVRRAIRTTSMATTTTNTATNTSTVTNTSSSTASTATNSTTNTITDQYSVFPFFDGENEEFIPIPGAPYSGTFGGPGLRISNIPDNRTITSATSSTTATGTPLTSTSSTSSSVVVPGGTTTTVTLFYGGTFVNRTTADFFSEVSESLDVDLHTISFGVHAALEFPRVRVSVSSGLALNIADWDAAYREDLFVSINGGPATQFATYQDHSGGTELLPGFYIELTSNVRLSERVSLFIGGRYDWAGSLKGSVGPSTFSLDVGGWSVMGGMTISL